MFKKYNEVRDSKDLVKMTDVELLDLHKEVSLITNLSEYLKKMEISLPTYYSYRSKGMPISMRNRLIKSMRKNNLFPYRVFTKEVTYFCYDVLACNELEARTKAPKYHLQRKMGKSTDVDIVVDNEEIAELDHTYDNMEIVARNYSKIKKLKG